MYSPVEQSLVKLQAAKEEQYGFEWKKRGFVSSYFNTGRKLERLVTMWNNGWEKSGDGDTRLDTLVDLLNYAILNFLLHGEKYPDILQMVLAPYQLSVDTGRLIAHKDGFQYFCEELLYDLFRKHPLPQKTWHELVNDLIALAQGSVDGWLDQLALVSEDKSSGNSLYEGNFHPKVRMENLLSLIVLSYFAVIQQALQHPAEWKSFLEER